MIKSAIAAVVAAPFLATAAFAGPYVNVEANAGLTGSDYTGTTTDFHVGYEGTAGKVSYYGQVGPALVTPNGGDSDVRVSGKVGASVAATDKLNVYGEYSAITTDDDLSSGIKAGLKYAF